jgi:hypothetical protein
MEQNPLNGKDMFIVSPQVTTQARGQMGASLLFCGICNIAK